MAHNKTETCFLRGMLHLWLSKPLLRALLIVCVSTSVICHMKGSIQCCSGVGGVICSYFLTHQQLLVSRPSWQGCAILLSHSRVVLHMRRRAKGAGRVTDMITWWWWAMRNSNSLKGWNILFTYTCCCLELQAAKILYVFFLYAQKYNFEAILPKPTS